MIASYFIRRPKTAIVFSLFITLFGVLAILRLPVAQYPSITPPVVQVTATYTGADAETIEQTVITPLETEINGTPGMAYIESTASSDGRVTLNVTFEVGTDVDIAAVEVQNRVAVAEALLPEEVRRLGVTTKKRNPSILLIVSLFSPDGTHGIDFINNYINIYVKEELLRVPGVGDIFARAEDFSMRVWLDPEQMAAIGVSVDEVLAALREQNLQVAAGRVGAPPQVDAQAFEYTVFTNGRLQEVEEFERVIIKRSTDSQALVFLKDIARVQLGRFDYATNNFTDGLPAAYLLVYQTPDSNLLDTEAGIRETMERLKERFPPDLEYVVPFESASVVRASINEVVKTLFLALALVSVVVFLFLQNWRATLIPLLIIPVSIIGTFAVFLPLGFTINTLTLFGFVLAIGIVVDDAIVVVEASLALLESGKRSVREAVEEAMGQISGPVIAMSLIVAAVFIPVGFIPGIVGRLYLQFAMAIAVSGLISGFVALSLTPALCVLLLKPIKKEENATRYGFFAAFNRGFDRFQGLFQAGMRHGLRRIPLALGALLLLALATVGMFSLKSTGFIPTEDEGRLFITFELPEGASTRRTLTTIQKLMTYLDEQEEVLHYSGVTGLNAVNFATKTSAGTVFTQLQPWEKRSGREQGAFAVKARMERELAALLPEASVVIIAPAAIPGLGSTAGFTFNLQALDATGSVKDFENNLQEFLAALREDEAIGNVFSFFSASTPALRYNLDREKTAGLGLGIGQVYEALQVYSGSFYVNDFILYNRNFRVIVQADSAFRRSEDDLRRLFVQSPEGSRVPLSSLFEVERIEQAPLITHFNLFRSAAINGESAPGKSSGDAIAALERRAAELLPAGYSYSFSGISREEVAAGSATFFIFTLSILMVFLCLTALYESWSLPFTVLFVLPVGAFGAILTLLLFPSLDNNVYAQIGLLTLVGLTAKNAILIVEYAKVLEEKGEGTLRAVLTAFQLRFRPIVMTSLAFIFGVLPLAFATGAGALARQTIGWTVFGGMLAATLLTLIFVPTLYVVIARVRGSRKA